MNWIGLLQRPLGQGDALGLNGQAHGLRLLRSQLFPHQAKGVGDGELCLAQ